MRSWEAIKIQTMSNIWILIAGLVGAVLGTAVVFIGEYRCLDNIKRKRNKKFSHNTTLDKKV